VAEHLDGTAALLRGFLAPSATPPATRRDMGRRAGRAAWPTA
jgi:hypothetical protein